MISLASWQCSTVVPCTRTTRRCPCIANHLYPTNIEIQKIQLLMNRETYYTSGRKYFYGNIYSVRMHTRPWEFHDSCLMLTTNMKPNPLGNNHNFISHIILGCDDVSRVNAFNSLIMHPEEISFRSVRSDNCMYAPLIQVKNIRPDVEHSSSAENAGLLPFGVMMGNRNDVVKGPSHWCCKNSQKHQFLLF
jgi:hypothetical protein